MYIDAGSYSTLSAKLKLLMTGSTARKWKIKVSQVECNSKSKPEQGCLQYFTGSSGTVKTFNWDDNQASLEHLNNQKYQVCIRQESGYCTIGWKQSSDPDSFKISRAIGALNSLNTIGCETNTQNQYDFVLIPNGNDFGIYSSNCKAHPATTMNSIDKYCGGTLTCISGTAVQAEVVSNVRPFTLGVQFNDEENAAHNNRGFKLNYQQKIC